MASLAPITPDRPGELLLSVSRRELMYVVTGWLALGMNAPAPGVQIGAVPCLTVTDGKGGQRRLYFSLDADPDEKA